MNPKYAPLFQTYTLNNGVTIKNRLAVAPMTHFGSQTDGLISDQERTFLSNRAGDIPQIGWQGNDIIDADFVEIPPVHIRQADNSLLQDSVQPHIRKGGRPKKYATAAERQAAYRARRAA